MDPALNAELRELFASARAWLAEFSEEGLERLELPANERPAAAEAKPGPVEAEATSGTSPAASSSATGLEDPAPTEGAAAAGEPARPAPVPATDLFAPTWGDSPTLDEVREALGDCQRCPLHAGRTQIVFGDGNPEADLMFVGEGPGAEEDRRGLPFVGRAGELLTAMIEKGLGLPRSEVYICNIVKCRPPQNRTPLPEEVRSCNPFLDGQISAVRPRVIVALGKPAASQLAGHDVAITRERGTWQDYRGIPVMPTLHPAYVLRKYTPENRRAVWDDLRAALDRARSGT